MVLGDQRGLQRQLRRLLYTTMARKPSSHSMDVKECERQDTRVFITHVQADKQNPTHPIIPQTNRQTSSVHMIFTVHLQTNPRVRQNLTWRDRVSGESRMASLEEERPLNGTGPYDHYAKPSQVVSLSCPSQDKSKEPCPSDMANNSLSRITSLQEYGGSFK